MIVVDAHLDIAFNAVELGRDYLINAHEKRRMEAGTPVAATSGQPTIGLPDSLLGRVGIVFGTLYVEPARSHGMIASGFSQNRYSTPREAYTLALRQLDYYQRLFDNDSRLRPIRSQKELDEVLATWKAGQPAASHVQGMVLLMENADPILEPRQFEEWYERGVRVVGPAWSGTRYCGGTGEPGPLTALGHELLDVMASFNALLDLSHMAEESFFEALDRYTGHLIASHSNPRRFVGDADDARQRQLTDMQIRRLVERDGVIGAVPFNVFLQEGWKKGDPRLPVSRFLDAIDAICQLAGSAAHVGIGTDFDGGFGVESIPEPLDTTTDLWSLGDLLNQRGYSQADVEAILCGNFLRKLRAILPAA